MQIVTEEAEKNLMEHLLRYYSHRGPIEKIEPQKNRIGEEIFRLITFKGGSYVTFCLRMDNKTWDRHSGGGRYGATARYEG